MTHLLENELVLHYYGEAADGRVQQHLDACDECRSQYRSLQHVLNIVDGYPVPERGAEYGAEVWQRLHGKVGQTKPKAPNWWTWIATPTQWAWAAALVVALGGAFNAGRMSMQPANPMLSRFQEGAAPESKADGRILLSAVGNHLDRTQMVLLELSNVAPDGSIQTAQADVQDLLNANRLYRTTADQAGEGAVAETLDELERLLVEVAHLAPKLTPAQAEELRQRILDRGILWKLRVVGSGVKERAEESTSL